MAQLSFLRDRGLFGGEAGGDVGAELFVLLVAADDLAVGVDNDYRGNSGDAVELGGNRLGVENLRPGQGEFLDSLAAEHRVVVTLEDGILDGGWGERVACYLACTPVRTRTFGIAKGFPDRYEPNELLAQNGMTVENMAAEAVRLLNE